MQGIGSLLFFILSFEFTASVESNVVNLGEPFNIEVKITGENIKEEPVPPDLPEFTLSGRSTYTSSQITIINGKMEKSSTISYVFTYIPKKAGDFEIPPFTLNYKGKTYYTNKINLTVVGEKKEKKEIKQKGSIFIETIVSRNNVYEGEGIMVEYKLFTRRRITGLDFSKRPDFPNFWKDEIYVPKEVSFKREIVNGIEYYTMTLYKVLLYPLRSGNLTIPEIGLYVQVPSSDFFDFFGSTYEILSEEKSVNVKPLPSPKPEGFCGGVGNFKTRIYFEKDTVLSGVGTNLVFEVEGSGNVRFITPPEIKGDNEINVYKPEEQVNIKSKTDIEKGVKRFKYLVVPLKDGFKSLKSFRFSYFDPKKNIYVVDTIKVPQLIVIPGEMKEEKEIKRIGKDIYFIKTDFKLKDYKFLNKFFYALTFFLTIFPLIGLFYFIENTRRMKDIGYSRLKNLPKITKIGLKKLKIAMKKKDDKSFFDQLHKLLLDFVKHRYNIESYGITIDELKENMIKKGIEKRYVDEFAEILNLCNLRRYSPVSENADIERIFKKTKEILNVLS